MAEDIASAAPRGYHSVNPYLTVRHVPAFLQFVQKVFDATVLEAIRQPDGRIAHTEVRIGDTVLMVGSPEVGTPTPRHPQPRPGTFYVYVPDVNATYHRAMVCGANSWEAPTDRFYGDRVAAVVDDNDNVWWIATKQRALSVREQQDLANQQWGDGKQTV